MTVVEDYPDVDPALTPEEVAAYDERYMLVGEAQEYNPDATAGDYLEMEIPIENFGRAAIQSAKQILLQKVRDAERDKIFEDYQHRIGTLVSGSVQQVDRGNILVNLGKTEGIIPLKEQIRKERYRQGDTIRAFIANVSTNTKGPQILLSRTHPDFLAELFKLEVPEIYDGIVIIRGVARDPGYRAKIAVSTKDDRIDPVGACVGMKGNRVQAIVRELSNERIDIIHWSDDPHSYIRRALSPANIKQITEIGDGRVVIIVGDEDPQPGHRPRRAERAPRLQAHRQGARHLRLHRIRGHVPGGQGRPVQAARRRQDPGSRRAGPGRGRRHPEQVLGARIPVQQEEAGGSGVRTPERRPSARQARQPYEPPMAQRAATEAAKAVI